MLSLATTQGHLSAVGPTWHYNYSEKLALEDEHRRGTTPAAQVKNKRQTGDRPGVIPFRELPMGKPPRTALAMIPGRQGWRLLITGCPDRC